MLKPVFNRYERKYIVSSSQKQEMIAFLTDHLIFDAYSLDSKPYTIYSIYFDAHDFSVIRNSIGKPTYKDKLRLRSYIFPIHDDDFVFLEIKKKFDGRINKRRVFLTYKQAMDYINFNIKPVFTTYIDKQILNEIDYFINIHKAKPGAFISYNRIAMVSLEDDLRVTFDSEILFRNQDLTLEKSGGTPILNPPDLFLMEVKSSNNFPFWLARKLSEFELYSQSFSKYGKAYQQYLLGGTSDDFILY